MRLVALSKHRVEVFDQGPDWDILDPRCEEDISSLAEDVAFLFLGHFEPASV
jgi:hypothetical protein